MHPAVHGNRRQSLAEATVAPGTRTQLHRHAITEEIYHITAGCGLMTLGDTCIKVGAGDTVANKKPAPDIYQWVLAQLALPASACLAIEDSANGLKASRGAEMCIRDRPWPGRRRDWP